MTKNDDVDCSMKWGDKGDGDNNNVNDHYELSMAFDHDQAPKSFLLMKRGHVLLAFSHNFPYNLREFQSHCIITAQ